MKNKKYKLFRDWMPLRIDGISVEVFFPSAYDGQEAVPTVQTEAVEAALRSTYRSEGTRDSESEIA